MPFSSARTPDCFCGSTFSRAPQPLPCWTSHEGGEGPEQAGAAAQGRRRPRRRPRRLHKWRAQVTAYLSNGNQHRVGCDDDRISSRASRRLNVQVSCLQKLWRFQNCERTSWPYLPRCGHSSAWRRCRMMHPSLDELRAATQLPTREENVSKLLLNSILISDLNRLLGAGGALDEHRAPLSPHEHPRGMRPGYLAFHF
eukprot:702842-Pleurochrysis_carterae.AAC.4